MTTTETPRVIGLDLSLTSSGVASSLGWTDTIRPKKNRTGLRGLDRLRMIVDAVRSYTSGYDLVAIEGPSFGHSGFRQHEELVALRWMVRDVVDRQQVPFAIVPPATLKLYATGRGNAKKADMAQAMDLKYPGRSPGFLAGRRFDEADALALADMGAAHLNGAPLTAAQQRAMAAVQWPEILEVSR